MVDYNKNEMLFFSSSFDFEQMEEIPDTLSCSSRNFTPHSNSTDQLFSFNSFPSHNYDDSDDDHLIFFLNERSQMQPSNISNIPNSQTSNDLCLSSTKESITLPSEGCDRISGKRQKYNKGRWKSSELRSFVEGLVLYGNEWKKIQTIIKTRSPTQTRSHAQKFFLRLRKKIDITISSAGDIRKFIYKYIEDYLRQSFDCKDNFFDIVFSIIFTDDELKCLDKNKKNKKDYFSIQKINKKKKPHVELVLIKKASLYNL